MKAQFFFEIEFVYVYGYRNLLFAMLNKVEFKFVIQNYCIKPSWTNWNFKVTNY